jgi:hypothetical protein
VYCMFTHAGGGVTAPNWDISSLDGVEWSAALPSKKIAHVPIGVPNPVSAFWEREESHVRPGMELQTVELVSQLTLPASMFVPSSIAVLCHVYSSVYPEALLILFFLTFPQLVSVCPRYRKPSLSWLNLFPLDICTLKNACKIVRLILLTKNSQPLPYAPTAECHVGESDGERSCVKFVLTGGGVPDSQIAV